MNFLEILVQVLLELVVAEIFQRYWVSEIISLYF